MTAEIIEALAKALRNAKPDSLASYPYDISYSMWLGCVNAIAGVCFHNGGYAFNRRNFEQMCGLTYGKDENHK